MSRKNSSSQIEEQLKKLKDIAYLNKEIDELKKQLISKDKEIATLKAKLAQSSDESDGEVSNLSSSSEETIARTQLALLEQKAMIQPLSLEEVRIYDLLVKNLRLSTEQATSTTRVLPAGTSKDELLKLAQANVKEEDE